MISDQIFFLTSYIPLFPRVNPGTWHTVLNICPCAKIAFDVFRQGELCQYGRILRNKFFASGDIDDYARLETGLLGLAQGNVTM